MSECKDECADHVQELLKQIEQLKDQLATADKHIGWLETDKIRLNKSIKIRDGAMDAFIDLEEVAAKKLTKSQAENKRLREQNQKFHGEIEWLCFELTRIQKTSITLFEVKDRAKRILEKVKL